MDRSHREIRSKLSGMSPRRATDYIRSLGLPADEEACIVGGDIQRLSHAELCARLHLSPEAVSRARRRAYGKIADDMGLGKR